MSPAREMHPEPYWLITLALVLGDQLTKYVVGALGSVVTVGPVTVGKVVNSAGVFGLDVPNPILIILGAVISVALLVLLIYTPAKPPVRLGLWLLLGGAVSNLIDRIFVGGAVDIIGITDVTRFNLADVMIVLGGLSLLRSLWWRA